MISTETVTIDGREFTYTYSDTYMIRKAKTDEIYVDAMDVQTFAYDETTEPLPIVEQAKDDIITDLKAQLAAKDAEISQLKAKMVRG